MPSGHHRSTIRQDERYTHGVFVNGRGQNLFYCATFPPAHVALRGVALFLHGIGEHSLRFRHVYRHLCLHGYGVLAYDMLGHGQSECESPGLRAHGSKFHYFVDDTNEFLTAAKRSVLDKMVPPATPNPSFFIMGISFGALVALHTILSSQHDFRACIVASPAIAVEYTLTLRMIELVSEPIGWLFPTARVVPGVNFNALTRDPDFYRDFMADPLNVTENLTLRMAMQVSFGMAQLQRHRDIQDEESTFCNVPLLALQGTEDKVTSVDSVQAFMHRIANKDKELKLFPGLFHCLYNEPEKQDVMEYATSWLNQRSSHWTGATSQTLPPYLETSSKL
ncbi:hypothetical protein PsorP6_010404 [Peronosclerospora sorghi]|uniref:Uncharacterized protein n=1 Tax=Peronosclerospora sorghi TaxID=230839 RepID=A0ACC0VTD7_9STRA|nr:hypothetical protein PsorP6_010404 [Peronosclerospora sorghi]